MSGTKPATVINVRGLSSQARAALEADPDFVYVGRGVPRARWPKNFDFSNPFTVANFPRTAVEHFERCLLAGMKLGTYPEAMKGLSWRCRPLTYWEPMAAKLPTLRGKTLGCWCCDWDGMGEPEKPCHAVVLARLANSLTEWSEP